MIKVDYIRPEHYVPIASIVKDLNHKEVRKFVLGRGNIGVCAFLNRKMVGGALYHLDTETLEIVKIGVDTKYRKRGVGTSLIKRMKSRLSKTRNTMLCYVPESADVLCPFFSKNGFCATLARNYFNNEDGYKFEFKGECYGACF